MNELTDADEDKDLFQVLGLVKTLVDMYINTTEVADMRFDVYGKHQILFRNEYSFIELK